MLRLILAALALLASGAAARAQTAACPAVVLGEVWTTAQWNTCFQSLAPLSGAALVSPSITGGAISTPSITGGTVAGAVVQPAGGIGQIVSVVTAAGTVVPAAGLSEVLIIAKTAPAATQVILPAASNWATCPSATLTACPEYVVKDGAGNAGLYPITVTTPDSKLIDGSATNVIGTNYGSARYVLNGAGWNVVP